MRDRFSPAFRMLAPFDSSNEGINIIRIELKYPVRQPYAPNR